MIIKFWPKSSIVIPGFFFLMLNSCISFSDQLNEAPIPRDSLKEDTVFFDIDTNFKGFVNFDVMPEFPGGDEGVKNYISENTMYPASAVKDGISGLVITRFVVDVDGSTTKADIFKSVRADLDNECIRVIEEMPKWKPGSTAFRAKKGLYMSTFPVYYMIPFNFVLTGSGNKKGIIIRPD